jgi:signal transduction histidine kinase
MALAILLVEDSPYDRELTCWALRDGPAPGEPIDIAVAASWPGARRKLMERPFDVLLLDFDLPGPDGLQALGELSDFDAHPPVVMLTGQRDLGRAAEMLRCGAAEYVSKNGEDWMRDLRATIVRVAEYARRERKRASSEIERDARARRLETEVAAAPAELDASDRRVPDARAGEWDLLAQLRRELRRPLETILDCSEHLGRKAVSAAARAKLERVRSSAAQLGRTVDSLLEPTSLATGAASLHPGWFGLADLAWEVERGICRLAAPQPVEIEWRFPGGDAEVEHDRGKIRRIARELLSAAVRVAPGGRVRATLAPTARGGVVLEVARGGPGPCGVRETPAPDDDRRRNGSVTRPDGGLGRVRQVATLLAGTVRVQNAGGRGACVAVHLPPVWRAAEAQGGGRCAGGGCGPELLVPETGQRGAGRPAPSGAAPTSS